MKVLVIGDTHAPFAHPETLRFLKEQKKKWNPDQVVHIGDLSDQHAISDHGADPSGMQILNEIELARIWCGQLAKIFPEVKICIGNHDERFFRRAFKSGIPKAFLKSYNEILGLPKTWKWPFKHKIEEVLYVHGTGTSGRNGHIKLATRYMCSTVIGHTHAHAGVNYFSTEEKEIFAANTGCLVDDTAYAFKYAKTYPEKSTLGCLIVVDGKKAIFEPLE